MVAAFVPNWGSRLETEFRRRRVESGSLRREFGGGSIESGRRLGRRKVGCGLHGRRDRLTKPGVDGFVGGAPWSKLKGDTIVSLKVFDPLLDGKMSIYIKLARIASFDLHSVIVNGFMAEADGFAVSLEESSPARTQISISM
jgi:hypothetical protein